MGEKELVLPVAAEGRSDKPAGMDPKKSEDIFAKAVEAVPDETHRLLDRMVAMGWIYRWSRNDQRCTYWIEWTPTGIDEIARLRSTIESLGYSGLKSWIALDAIVQGNPGVYIG